ncbi:MAG: hypothetical protein IT195_10115 [Microthrixaceae bacterium]|nr:hypothetical protein [Microthrixaceae bacterium]
MSSPSPTATTARGIRIILGLLAALLLSAGTAACNKEQRPLEAFFYANQERTERNLGVLRWDDELATKAQQWANRLAQSGTLAHSTLTDGVTGGWNRLGENVGSGGDVHNVHDGFMNSPDHRAAILGNFDRAGMGVVERGGKVWVVQVFEG